MLKYLLLCTLLVPVVLGAPLLGGQGQSDFASHIVIVTPQAQVHLEPAIKYDAASFIHHLSPLARIAAPHEETIVYVPASAGASIIPVESASVGRASASEQQQKQASKQWDQISQQIQQAVQTGSSQLGPQLSEAASAASSAAAAAGQGLFPALFPPAAPASSASSAISSTGKEDKPKISYELPANTEALLTSNARIYALTPAVSHVVDFVHSPIFVGPISAIRARSIQGDAQEPLTTAALAGEKSEQLPLKDITKNLKKVSPAQAKEEIEKSSDYGKLLGANALKEEKNLSDESEAKKEKLPEDNSNKFSDIPKGGLSQAPLPALPSKLKSGSSDDVNISDDHKEATKGAISDPEPQPKIA
ncbi:uncharacterized protein LOC118748191 [Rhagoletis pomonella]|uniref:uncharacterized protein LOC118748191 n=1 Tax=Rhagoletis pomonella TaxID=28610 RepID=UPI00177DBFFF|nr:uncharacterized protein LOC118748191 [Rhagoletis pomonella]